MNKKGIYFMVDENILQKLTQIAEKEYNGNKTVCFQDMILGHNKKNLLDQEYTKLYSTFRKTYELLIEQINVNIKQNTSNEITTKEIVKSFQATTRELLDELKKLNPTKL